MPAVILAGGQGERFWPMTHEGFPKYRLKLDHKKSLLQKTYDRLRRFFKKEDIYIVTTESHRAFIFKELKDIAARQVIVEPCRNNTAPAIYLSCALLQKKVGSQAVVSFFPADHLIENHALLGKTLKSAQALARKKRMLVTIGIQPIFPATGYGYIEKGAPIAGFGGFQVKRFVEKPNKRRAAVYLKSKRFFWNAGIFTWRLDTFFQSMERHSPGFGEDFSLARLRQTYQKLPKLSIDYALMEKADNVAVCPASMDWCDVGNWDVFFEKGNRGSTIINHTDRPLVVAGFKNAIIVQTPQGTLVCRRGHAEETVRSFLKK